jgi:hypothetical protein
MKFCIEPIDIPISHQSSGPQRLSRAEAIGFTEDVLPMETQQIADSFIFMKKLTHNLLL